MSDRPAVVKIITSTMVRAQQTVNIIHQSIPLEEDNDLQEGSPEWAYTAQRFKRMFLKYFVPARQTEAAEAGAVEAGAAEAAAEAGAAEAGAAEAGVQGGRGAPPDCS